MPDVVVTMHDVETAAGSGQYLPRRVTLKDGPSTRIYDFKVYELLDDLRWAEMENQGMFSAPAFSDCDNARWPENARIDSTLPYPTPLDLNDTRLIKLVELG